MVIYIIEIVDLPINSMVDLSSLQTVAVYQAGYISHNIHFYISLEDPRSEHGCNNRALGGCDFDKKKRQRFPGGDHHELGPLWGKFLFSWTSTGPSTYMKTGWWLVRPTPLKNDGVKVSWDDDMTPI